MYSPACICNQEDATKTSFADGSFALVIDKGCADMFALSDDVGTLGRYFAEVVRLLRVGGVFAIVTAWTPERRAERLGPLPLKLVSSSATRCQHVHALQSIHAPPPAVTAVMDHGPWTVGGAHPGVTGSCHLLPLSGPACPRGGI